MSDETSNFGAVPPTNPQRPSDADLLASLRLKSREALEVLYDRYSGIVMALCLRIVRNHRVAGKIVEDIFYDLFEHPERGGGPLVNRLLSQARTIAIQRRKPLVQELDALAADSSQSKPDDNLAELPDLRWQRERARAALAWVPVETRQIMEMICLDAWSIDETARRLNLAPEEVRAFFVGGMRAFRDALQSMPAAVKPQSPFDFPPVSLDRVRVLIVDDEPDARRILAFALQAVGALVTAAASVAEAMMLLPTTNPDVLLSDLAMPAEDGFDLIRKVRGAGRTARDLPAVALTAFATGQIRRDVMRAGFQMHVPKPVDPHQLAEIVASLTGRTG
jgi:CheY-like chemotaxis protein